MLPLSQLTYRLAVTLMLQVEQREQQGSLPPPPPPPAPAAAAVVRGGGRAQSALWSRSPNLIAFCCYAQFNEHKHTHLPHN